MNPETPSNPSSDESKEGFSAANKARELITEVPTFDNETPADLGPIYTYPEKAEMPTFEADQAVAVLRTSGDLELDWKIGRSLEGNDKYLVTKIDPKTGDILEKPVTAAELVKWRPKFSPEDSLSIPSDDPKLVDWTVVDQATNGDVRILSKYSSPSEKSFIRVISAVEAAKYRA